MPTLLLSEKVVFVSLRFLPDYFFLLLLRAVKRGGVLTIWAVDMAICSGTWALPDSVGILVGYGFIRLGRVSMHN